MTEINFTHTNGTTAPAPRKRTARNGRTGHVNFNAVPLAAGHKNVPLKFPKGTFRAPNIVLLSGLFHTLAKYQQRPYYELTTPLPARYGHVDFVGYAFDQFDFDVLCVALSLLGGQPFVVVALSEILKILGLSKQTNNRQHVRESLRRLSGYRHDDKGEYAKPKVLLDGLVGKVALQQNSCVNGAILDARKEGSKVRIALTQSAQVFLEGGNWALLNIKEFQALRSGLERRLYGLVRAHRQDRPHKVKYQDLRAYLGYANMANNQVMRNFKYDLKRAMQRLTEIETEHAIVSDVEFTKSSMNWTTLRAWKT